jgi:Xaa-Pro aminopeptidase
MRAHRQERLQALLEARDLESVWFAGPDTFAWLTGGSNVVASGEPVGVGAAGFDGEALRVVTDDIEAERLSEEEVSCPVEAYEWHAGSLAEAVAKRAETPAGADFDVPGFESVDPSPLRRPLTDEDVEAYREAGRETAAAVEATCRAASRDDTEAGVAADLRARLAERGLEAPVVLVGGERRAQAYRHYTPTDERLGGYALVSVTTRRDGLYSSCTRTVAFDPPAWLLDNHAAAATVEATALAATRAGGQRGDTAGDVFSSIERAYAAQGFRGEWREHHQGGAAGYAGREWFATPGSGARLDLPMAYAWNPTVQGAKSEDTVLVSADGYEVLTATGEWPTLDAEAVDYEATFERPAVLVR